MDPSRLRLEQLPPQLLPSDYLSASQNALHAYYSATLWVTLTSSRLAPKSHFRFCEAFFLWVQR